MPSSDDPLFRSPSCRAQSRGRSLAAIGAALALLAGRAAVAQNPPDQTTTAAASAGQLQTVTVTAQFTSQSVQQTPLAITAISAEQLSDRGQTSILDIAQDAPSVNLAAQSAAYGPSMAAYIRGIGQDDLDPGLEPGIGIYIDDVYFGTITGSIFDLLDLDRVEVLRGPQGTLEGMNSEGGAIKLFSKAPDATESTTFDLLGGSRNHVELRASTDFALTDNLFLRISGVGNHQDGYENVYDFGCANPTFTATPVTFSPSGVPTYGTPGTYSVAPGVLTKANSCQNGQLGGTSYAGGRVAVRWVASDNLDVQFIGDLTNVNQEDPAETLIYGGPGPLEGNASATLGALSTITATNTVTGATALIPYDVAKVPALVSSNPYTTYNNFCLPANASLDEPAYCTQDTQSIENWGGESLVNWTISPDLSIRNILAERGYSSNWGEDNGASIWPNSIGQEGIEHHQFSEELRFTGKWGSVLDYTLGGFYFRELSVYEAHEDLAYVTPTDPGIYNFLQDDPIYAHDKAGYLHLVWHATSKLDATFGTRYTSQDKTYNYVRLTVNDTPSPLFVTPLGSLNGASSTYTGARWDWRADVDYHFTDQVMAYAQFSTGFKGGGVDPRPFYLAQAVRYNPEYLDTYEVGLKSTWLDDHLRVNLDGYFSQYRNIQETLGDCIGIEGIPAEYGIPCALPYNAGDAHQKGVELESQLRFGGFQADASLSYIDFNYVSLNPLTGITLDMITPNLLKWQGNAGAQYTFSVPTGSLTARLDASARSYTYTYAVNGPYSYIGGYTTYNAHLTWEPPKGNWQIILSAINLTDKRYWQNVFDLVPVGAGTVDGVPSAPLELDLEVKHTMQ